MPLAWSKWQISNIMPSGLDDSHWASLCAKLEPTPCAAGHVPHAACTGPRVHPPYGTWDELGYKLYSVPYWPGTECWLWDLSTSGPGLPVCTGPSMQDQSSRVLHPTHTLDSVCCMQYWVQSSHYVQSKPQDWHMPQMLHSQDRGPAWGASTLQVVPCWTSPVHWHWHRPVWTSCRASTESVWCRYFLLPTPWLAPCAACSTHTARSSPGLKHWVQDWYMPM